MFGHKPPEKMNLLGTFNSMHDAEKAMKNTRGADVARRVVGIGLTTRITHELGPHARSGFLLM